MANNPVNIQIGDLNVSITMENGEVVKITAVDQYGHTFDLGFVLEPIPVNGGCEICRYIAGKKVCWEVDCLLVRPPVDYGKSSEMSGK